jgi:hypothetical protein
MVNPNTNPVTEDELAEIRRLLAEGRARTEIFCVIGRSLRTISVHAAKMGLTFDRTMTGEATRARKADLEERRVILAEPSRATPSSSPSGSGSATAPSIAGVRRSRRAFRLGSPRPGWPLQAAAGFVVLTPLYQHLGPYTARP